MTFGRIVLIATILYLAISIIVSIVLHVADRSIKTVDVIGVGFLWPGLLAASIAFLIFYFESTSYEKWRKANGLDDEMKPLSPSSIARRRKKRDSIRTGYLHRRRKTK